MSRWCRLTRLAFVPLLGAVAWQLLRSAAALPRQLRDYRTAARRLRAQHTTILGAAGSRTLRLHTLVADLEAGSPPIVIVQGLGIGGGYMVPLAGLLADRAAVYIPDLPGHGASQHDTRPQTIAELALSVAAWMDAMRLSRAVLVGHSLGCQIAAELAVRRPELVSGLVLVAPTQDPAARGLTRLLARAVLTGLCELPTVYFWLFRDYPRAGLRLLLAELHSLRAHHVEEVLPQIRIPVRVVRGTLDAVVPQAWAETVARLTSAPPPVRVCGWAHAVHYDSPARVAAVVMQLLEKPRPEGLP
jgi:2-hydroxy-6-oxonona-2,4-dienedioate hydrolase